MKQEKTTVVVPVKDTSAPKKEGVSAPVPVQAASATQQNDRFNLVLLSGGEQPIAVIKVIKESLNLPIKSAKALVDGAPLILKYDMRMDDAERLKRFIEESGGKVELQ